VVCAYYFDDLFNILCWAFNNGRVNITMVGFIIVFLIVGGTFLFLSLRSKKDYDNTMDSRYQPLVDLLVAAGTNPKIEKIKDVSLKVTTQSETKLMIYDLREGKDYLTITLMMTDLKKNKTERKEWQFNKYLNPDRMFEVIRTEINSTQLTKRITEKVFGYVLLVIGILSLVYTVIKERICLTPSRIVFSFLLSYFCVLYLVCFSRWMATFQ
jgi:hypothetical protein